MSTKRWVRPFKICLNHIPETTTDNEPIYLSGNFNDWKEKDKKYQIKTDDNGIKHVLIKYTGEDVKIEFKFCRGTWSTVECDATGNDIPNRTLLLTNESVCYITNIAGWKDKAGDKDISQRVSILELNFQSEALSRNVKVFVYLPPNYQKAHHLSYPVLYLQDGQNIFKKDGISDHSWSVNTILDQLYSEGMGGIIVVAISHGENERINEYSPWVHPEHGGGKGKQYLDYVVDTIKPSIDRRLRTLADNVNTGVMGSSMGGLLSMFAILERPDIFGKAGIFSPSFWFIDEIYALAARVEKKPETKILFLGGNQESESMMSDLMAMYYTLIDTGFNNDRLHIDLHEDGNHSEWFWSREFAHAIQWLFGADTHDHHKDIKLETAKFKGSHHNLIVTNLHPQNLEIQLIGPYQKTIWHGKTSFQSTIFTLPIHLNGMYLVKIYQESGTYNFEKVIL